MIEIFKSVDGTNKMETISTFEKGCWINVTSPGDEELLTLEKELGIVPNFLRDPLDEEEKPRIDMEDNQTLVIVDIPFVRVEENNLRFETMPMGIIITDEYFLTISLRANAIVDYFREKKVRDFYTFKKTRFTYQVLFMIAKDFLKYLRHIDKKTDDIEKTLNKSMRNKELFKLLELEKSLVFFTTSLKSNEIMMEKLLRGRYIRMYEEDQELLEDVLIEVKQAIEMANIYSSILSGTMDAYASVISNNLNIVMKFLASVTIVMAIPTMVSGFFGMNVVQPLGDNRMGFWIVLLLTFGFCAFAVWLLNRKKMF